MDLQILQLCQGRDRRQVPRQCIVVQISGGKDHKQKQQEYKRTRHETATEPTTIDTSHECKQLDNYCFARQQSSQTSGETAALACMSSALTKEDESRQSKSPPWAQAI